MSRHVIRWLAFVFVATAAASTLWAVQRYRPEWLPSWARFGAPAAPSNGLFCKEHGVPEAYCTLCHAELEQTLERCTEHGGVPEALCTKCHPEQEKALALEMCPKGHGMPRSFCPECKAAAAAQAVDDGWCAAHRAPEALCAECEKGGKKTKECRADLPLIELANKDIAKRLGFESAPVAAKSHAHTLKGNAEIAYVIHNYAEVRPRVPGRLTEVPADEGQIVEKGQLLAVVDSADVGSAKAIYLSAIPAAELAEKNLSRMMALRKTDAVAEIDELTSRAAANQAAADLLNARQRLKNYGFTDEDLAEVARTKETSSLLRIVSPMKGTLVERHAVPGEAVEAVAQLFAITDLGVMWVWIDIYESEIDEVRIGQPVTFRIAGADSPAFHGHVDLIGSAVNPVTRTIRVRGDLVNIGTRLRANQFGQAEIQTTDEHEILVVPKAAVQRINSTDLVFLPDPDGVRFRPQRVLAKPTEWPDLLEIAWGVKKDQEVVTTGAFMLKSEMLKNELGPGCCP